MTNIAFKGMRGLHPIDGELKIEKKIPIPSRMEHHKSPEFRAAAKMTVGDSVVCRTPESLRALRVAMTRIRGPLKKSGIRLITRSEQDGAVRCWLVKAKSEFKGPF